MRERERSLTINFVRFIAEFVHYVSNDIQFDHGIKFRLAIISILLNKRKRKLKKSLNKDENFDWFN